jgi:AraC-like DNA-binding protein
MVRATPRPHVTVAPLVPLVPVLERRRGRVERLVVAPDAFARLCRARDYLAAFADRRVSLAAAAREASLSPFHFQRSFVAAFGESPHEFLTRLRVERAKRALASTSRSVTEICFDVGYESLGSFSARFRALTGVSPSEYRRGVRRSVAMAHLWCPLFIPSCFVHRFAPSPLGGATARSEKHPATAAPIVGDTRPQPRTRHPGALR